MDRITDISYTVSIHTANDDTVWVHFDLYSEFSRQVLFRLADDITHKFTQIEQETVYANFPFNNKKIRKLAEWLGFVWMKDMRTRDDWGVRTIMRLDRQNVITRNSYRRTAE